MGAELCAGDADEATGTVEATWDSAGAEICAGAADEGAEGAGAADEGAEGAGTADEGAGAAEEVAGAAEEGPAGTVLATWDSAGAELAAGGGGAMEPVFCGGATHLVQIVMVEVTFTVDSSVTTLIAVLPPWVRVLETGQLVTVV